MKINDRLIRLLSKANTIAAPCIVIAGGIWFIVIASVPSFIDFVLGLLVGFIAAIFTCGPISVLLSIKESLDGIRGVLEEKE